MKQPVHHVQPFIPGFLFVIAAAVFLSGCPSCQDGIDEGDAFVVLMDSSPDGLDPRFAMSHSSAQLVSLLHEGLISMDTQDGTMELRLARSIEQTSPVRYEVELRDDAVFHDGEPVTAHDVEYTYMTLRDVGSPRGAMTDRIDTFEIVDDHHFIITLDEPYAPFEMDLSMGILPRHICANGDGYALFDAMDFPFSISPKVVHDGHGTCQGKPIGAGPFRFHSRDGGLRVEFRRFDDYFLGAPEIERLVFRVIRDDNARLLALLGDTADVVQNAVSPMMMPVVEDSERLEIQSDPSFKYTYLGINLEHPILGDKKVRQALAYAINREEIIEHKFGGAARLSKGVFVPEHWAHEEDVAVFSYDPERANELLDEAGYEPDAEGKRFEIEFKVSANNFRRSLAMLMAQQLGEVGIDVRVRAYEWGTFFSDIQSRNFEITTLQWPSILDPSLLQWIFHSDSIPTADARSSGANRGGFRNDRVDELLDQGQRETDREERQEIYGEVQKILAEELPYISLWHEDNVAVVRKGVEGYYTTPNAHYNSLRTAIPAPTSD